MCSSYLPEVLTGYLKAEHVSLEGHRKHTLF